MMPLEEIQKTVLGTFLRFPERLNSWNMRPNLFARRSYSILCSCLVQMTAQGLPIEISTVWDQLEAKYPKHGLGLADLYELNDLASPSGQINYHIGRLESDHLSRSLRQLAGKVLTDTEGNHDPKDVVAQIEKGVSEIFAHSSEGFRPFQESVMESLERIDQAYRGGFARWITTGLSELDAIIGGWQPSDLIIIAGRPGMGKSAFMTNVTHHAANGKQHVACANFEMSDFDFDCRMFGVEDHRLIPSALRRGQVTSAGWVRLTEAATALSGLPISILDRPGITNTELIRAVRSLHMRQPLNLLTVDYLQLIESEERYSTRERAITETSKSLKRIAKELKIPVLAACSLNRQCDQRPDKRPQLSDLRESGNIESDADIAIFLYRDEVYDRDTVDKGICEILVRKNRHGPIGEIRVKFYGPTMTFC